MSATPEPAVGAMGTPTAAALRKIIKEEETRGAEAARDAEVKALVKREYDHAIDDLFRHLFVLEDIYGTLTSAETHDGLAYISDDLADNYTDWIAEGKQ